MEVRRLSLLRRRTLLAAAVAAPTMGIPPHPTRMLPQWDCGDHLHPNDAGYRRMGDGIDLKLFD